MADDPVEAYQSLYRRYRPQRFAEVRGQEHVTTALRNAVRSGRVGHAYLFSGPRGTGKTSTARILAMALNCEHPADGEPDGTCTSCVEIRRGSSLDVQELDAASNRGVDEMRDLLSRVSLGVRGRWKVYIIDEVHQLTTVASSALLKTLEEPPGHVVFVLATTDPQKVLPTIRSRTQHYEFKLLSADILGGLLDDINERAGLGVPSEAIDLVVRRGHGSARDALSVLDQVAAAGVAVEETAAITDVVDAIADRDVGRVLTAVAEGVAAGWEPRRLAADLLEHLRNGFLAMQARSLVPLPDDAAAAVEAQARRLGLAGTVRAMEVVGQAAGDMRDSVDPRVTLEVALVRVTAPAADTDPAALLARIERLEAALAGAGAIPASGAPTAGVALAPGPGAPGAPAPGPGAPGAAAAPTAPVPPPSAAGPPTPARPATGRPAPDAAPLPAGPADAGPPPRPARSRRDEPAQAPRPSLAPPPPVPRPGAGRQAPAGPDRGSAGPDRGPAVAPRATIGSLRRGAPDPAGTTPAAPTPPVGPHPPRRPQAPVSGAAPGPFPTRDELTKAWGDTVLPGLPGRVKAYLSQGRFVSADGEAVMALPDQGLLTRAEAPRRDAEAALTAHFGRPVPLRLVLDEAAAARRDDAPPSAPDDPDDYDIDDLTDAGPGLVSPEQRLLEAFPGAEEVAP
ncbi:MAG TPA: DNA polymerase III subunit gamma/tau [Acidimicrobiales bacterium]|nr:DNA polymerase III subunit gamma/tau [Acidimicrobiales bacterium]